MKYCPQCIEKYDDTQRFCTAEGAELVPDPFFLEGQTLSDKFQIQSLIDMGGMGAVYRAKHLNLNLPIAFKIVRPDKASSHFLGLFDKEAKTAAPLRHTNIVEIYDAGHAEGVNSKGEQIRASYIAMEWLDGRALDKELRGQGKLSIPRTQELLTQICAALDHAHSRQTIHRDLKPSNIMLVKQSDGSDRVKVLDFGIGKVMSNPDGTNVTTLAGTYLYGSPEQFIPGARIDHRSDIYSLGVLLFELLTGKVTKPLPLLRSLWPEALVAIEELLSQMTAQNPDDRPRNVSEIPALFAQACQQPVPVSVQPVQGDEQKTQPAVVSEPTIICPPASQLVGPDGFPLKTFEFTTVTVNDTGEIIERREEVMQGFIEDLGGGVMLEMVRIPAGTFLMGSPRDEEERSDNEGPQHRVTVPEFFMGRYAVTREQWRQVTQLSKARIDLEKDPSRFKDSWQQPVERINWHEVMEFCARLSQKAGKAFRLPSEAEWEYAARAGTTTPFAFGETITPQVVNYAGNYPYANAPKGTSREKTVSVGSLGVANAFGLYDMHGNVWEWCQDVLHRNQDDWHDWHENYDGAPIDGSAWTKGGDQNYRMLRGGSWDLRRRYCRSASRYGDAPGERLYNVGFRVVVSARIQ